MGGEEGPIRAATGTERVRGAARSPGGCWWRPRVCVGDNAAALDVGSADVSRLLRRLAVWLLRVTITGWCLSSAAAGLQACSTRAPTTSAPEPCQQCT
jgi:hypothetical protein